VYSVFHATGTHITNTAGSFTGFWIRKGNRAPAEEER